MTKIKAAIKSRIVPKWYKKWSVLLSGFFLVLSGAIMATPPEYLAWMPDYVKPLAFVIIIVAAALKQNNFPNGK
jgi:hypothetical protein